jgi:hypothetical protein
MFGKVPRKVVEEIPDDVWYSHLKKNQEARDKVWFDRESGRYYLVWSRPVEKGADKTFVGMVAVKIDLWDTFHRFSKQTQLPFLAFVNGEALYSHDWKRQKQYSSGAFAIPGVRKASLRWVGTESSVAAVEDAGPADDNELAEDAEVDSTAGGDARGSRGGALGVILVILLVLIAAGGGVFGYLAYRRKQEDLLRSIDQAPSPDAPPTPLGKLIDEMPDGGVDNLPDDTRDGEDDKPVV